MDPNDQREYPGGIFLEVEWIALRVGGVPSAGGFENRHRVYSDREASLWTSCLGGPWDSVAFGVPSKPKSQDAFLGHVHVEFRCRSVFLLMRVVV